MRWGLWIGVLFAVWIFFRLWVRPLITELSGGNEARFDFLYLIGAGICAYLIGGTGKGAQK